MEIPKKRKKEKYEDDEDEDNEDLLSSTIHPLAQISLLQACWSNIH
jgi:hypothetical protein